MEKIGLFPLFFIISILILLFFTTTPLCDESSVPLSIKVGLLDVEASTGGKGGNIEFTALRRIFQGLGIPFDVLNNTSRLKNYRMISTGGALLNRNLSSRIVADLYEYVEDGGTLLTAGEIGNKVYPLFGVKNHFPGRKRYRMTFVGIDDSLKYIDHPNEMTISLGNGEAHFYDEVIWSHGYSIEDEVLPLAKFDDGTVGFLLCRYGRGRAYLLGLSYTDSVLIPQIGKDYEAQRRFVNFFEPSCDVIMLIIRAIYESCMYPFVYISTIPYSLSTALVLTHDVDAQTSFLDSLKFAAVEERYGVKSTFFENTKYFNDAMDIGYYSIKENLEAIKKLKKGGWEIGSHTVSHSKEFSKAPEGKPGVNRQNYNPQNNITVYGEVQVSKKMLDHDIPGQVTVSFRAGHLQFPFSLMRILEESGYLYDSTFTSCDVLTSFPYFALKERRPDASESGVIEIPVTLDDSMGFLTPETLDEAVNKWIEVMYSNLNNEAITVLLMHPSDTREKNYKLKAQETLMAEVVRVGGWIGDLKSFGDFWRSRYGMKFKAYIEKDALIIVVDSKLSEINQATGFVVGNTKNNKVVVKTLDGRVLPLKVIERGGKLYIGGEWKSLKTP
ncbi:MAG: polysaccharide deacetylase family protein [Spirochaetota bacterium]